MHVTQNKHLERCGYRRFSTKGSCYSGGQGFIQVIGVVAVSQRMMDSAFATAINNFSQTAPNPASVNMSTQTGITDPNIS